MYGTIPPMAEDVGPGRLKAWQAYGLAVLVTAATLAIRLAVDGSLGGQPMLVMFTVPIMLSAYAGGLGPGLLATGLSFVMASYYLLPPIHSFQVASAVERWQQVLVALSGVVISVLNEMLHRARHRAHVASRQYAESAAAARDTADRLRTIIETEPECVKVVGADGRLEEMNPAGLAMLEAGSLAELQRTPLLTFITPEHREAFRALHQRVMAGGKDTLEFEVVGLMGGRRWLETHAAPLVDPDGRIRGLLGITRDISERKRSDEAVRESEARYRMLFDCSPDGIVIANPDHRTVDVNGSACRMLGYTREELLALHASDIVAPSEIPHIDPVFEATQAGEDYQREWLLRRKDGSLFAADVIATRTPDGNTMGLIRDVTERRRTQERLRDSMVRLRALSTRMNTIREQERASMARDVHDHLGQSLTALAMDVAEVRRRMRSADAAAVEERLQDMSALIDTAIDDVRRVATELRPVVLDDLGLVAAIRSYLTDIERRARMACVLTTSVSDLEIPDERATALFRILQEALTNVMRHASARRVDVSLEVDGAVVRLIVRDDGRGIPAAAPVDPRALGLTGMRDRALLFDGDVTITGEPGAGTTVAAHIPLGAHAP